MLRQCPKNLIRRSTVEKIELYDMTRAGVVPVAKELSEVSHYYFDLMRLIENQRYAIKRDVESVMSTRKESGLG